MTILVLSQKILPLSCLPKFYLAKLGQNFKKINEWFCVFNKGGLLSLALLLIIVISLVSYLAALFLTFGLGFKIQVAEREFTKLKDAAAILELQIQKGETSFAKDHKDVLESMERVSSIKYLTIDNFAVSSPQERY